MLAVRVDLLASRAVRVRLLESPAMRSRFARFGRCAGVPPALLAFSANTLHTAAKVSKYVPHCGESEQIHPTQRLFPTNYSALCAFSVNVSRTAVKLSKSPRYSTKAHAQESKKNKPPCLASGSGKIQGCFGTRQQKSPARETHRGRGSKNREV